MDEVAQMKHKFTFGRFVNWLLLLVTASAALFPFFWMALGSFKKDSEVFAIPLRFFPETWELANYERIFSDRSQPFGQSMVMTLIVAVSAVLLSLLVNTMAGYAFARTKFYGKQFFWVYCIMTMFIPGLTIMLTSFLVVNALRMLNTLAVLILPGVASGYSIFFFRQFFLNMPIGLEDAARIDGAGRFMIYWRMFIPMSKAPMVVLGAGAFMGYWNSFLWPSLTVNDPSLMQVMQIIRSMRSVYSTDYGAVMAATSITIVPPLILFFVFQKYIVQGVVLSGIK